MGAARKIGIRRIFFLPFVGIDVTIAFRDYASTSSASMHGRWRSRRCQLRVFPRKKSS